ncbi:MAG: CYTH domain-containing protein [Azoarcus sp.]|jgi:adenylate cyclase|nr:CYTH domain-containing protein [Azoarcus sp.]
MCAPLTAPASTNRLNFPAMPLEIELKLSFPAEALPTIMRHPLIASAPIEGTPGVLDNTYFDTPAFALRARKIALRLRRQGAEMLQTVKRATVSSGGLTRRPEWEQPWRGQFDFSGIDDPEAAALLTRVRDELVPVFTTRFHRDTRRFQPHSGALILAMIDTGLIEVDGEAGGRNATIHELELELVEGSEEALLRLADELKKDLPLLPEDASKAQRGYMLAAEQFQRDESRTTQGMSCQT